MSCGTDAIFMSDHDNDYKAHLEILEYLPTFAPHPSSFGDSTCIMPA